MVQVLVAALSNALVSIWAVSECLCGGYLSSTVGQPIVGTDRSN
jgi:hypothetical protein